MRLWHAFTYPEDPSIDERIRAAAAGVVAAGIADECPVVKRSGALFDREHRAWSGLIMWGQNFIRGINEMNAEGKPVVCLERGHFADRFERTRIARDGIFGRALRWPRGYEPMGLPVPREAVKRLLVIGQPHVDNACLDVDVPARLTDVIARAKAMGYEVLYRPHPAQLRIEAAQGVTTRVRCGAVDSGALADSLAWAGAVYTLTSGVAVTAALAGCRVIAAHMNSPMGGVVARDLSTDVPPPRLDAADRLGQLRACEFSVTELASGKPFAALMLAR